MIRIVADTTCDYPQELHIEEKITIIPLKVTINGMNYDDKLELSNQQFFELLPQSEQLPVTQTTDGGCQVDIPANASELWLYPKYQYVGAAVIDGKTYQFTENETFFSGDGWQLQSLSGGVQLRLNGYHGGAIDLPYTDLVTVTVSLYGDNSITGGTIKLGVDDASDEARVMLLGDVKEGEAGEETYHETGESAPYVGTGYIRVRRKDNKTSYIAYWVHKAIFGLGTESAKTKGQSIEWQTPTLEGSIMGVKNNPALQVRFRERRMFARESEARAWIDKKAGIEA